MMLWMAGGGLLVGRQIVHHAPRCVFVVRMRVPLRNCCIATAGVVVYTRSQEAG